MTYSRTGSKITIEFSFDEYRDLLTVLTFSAEIAAKSPLPVDRNLVAIAVREFLTELYRATPDLALYALLPPS